MVHIICMICIIDILIIGVTGINMVTLISEANYTSGNKHIHLWRSINLIRWSVWNDYFKLDKQSSHPFSHQILFLNYLHNGVKDTARIINMPMEMLFSDIL